MATDSFAPSAGSAELVTANREQLSRGEVIAWWELRRIPYNLVLLVIGVVCGGTAIFLLSSAVQPGEDVVEPVVMFFGVALYAIAANALYTLGGIVELIVRRFDPEIARKSAKVMFRWGFIGSCVLTTAPLEVALLVRVIGFFKKQ